MVIHGNSNYGVIFDMDGVITDTADLHYESWKITFGELGLKFPLEFFKKTFGCRSPEIVKMYNDEFGGRFTESEIIDIARKKEKVYRELAVKKLKPLNGIPELITNLREKGVRLAIGSSGPRVNIKMVLDITGLKDHFDAIIGEEDTERSKPFPDVFLNAAAAIGLPPNRCVVIEDAPVGIKAARAAGMKVIAVCTTHPADVLYEADIIKESPAEITVRLIFNLIDGKPVGVRSK